MACGVFPRELENCSAEQLVALLERLATDTAARADCAVFGRGQANVLRFAAHVLVNGTLTTQKVTGPPSLDSWRSCWRVFRAGMIMLRASLSGPLDEFWLRHSQTNAASSHVWTMRYAVGTGSAPGDGSKASRQKSGAQKHGSDHAVHERHSCRSTRESTVVRLCEPTLSTGRQKTRDQPMRGDAMKSSLTKRVAGTSSKQGCKDDFLL